MILSDTRDQNNDAITLPLPLPNSTSFTTGGQSNLTQGGIADAHRHIHTGSTEFNHIHQVSVIW